MRRERGGWGWYSGVNPRDQTAHQVKSVVYEEKSMPKEKSDERKGSQQRIEMKRRPSAGSR